MKRFYCTVCNKVKRVRKYPSDIQHVTDSVPTNRVGTCNWHTYRPTMIRRGQASNQKVGA